MSAEIICALSSAAGRSALGIVRVSGNGSLSLLDNFFVSKNKVSLLKTPRRARYGKFLNKDEIVDDVLIIPFPQGNSYTGEEMAEISCHGNPLIYKKILGILLESGIRMARPGEFSLRAVQNGKMDILQAQGVREIIEARGERALAMARTMQEGAFRKELTQLRTRLLNITSDVTAELDFTEEDLQFSSVNSKILELKEIHSLCQNLIARAKNSNILHDGVLVALVGAPNVGKSSLLNYLVGREKAMVSQIPGTTRDFIEEPMQIAGFSITFVDTAGIRKEATDPLEKKGIERTFQKIKEAKILLFLLDGSENPEKALQDSPISDFESIYASSESTPRALLINKADILHKQWENKYLEKIRAHHKGYISAKDGQGIKELFQFLTDTVENFIDSQGLLLAQWQTNLLDEIAAELEVSISLYQNKETLEIIVSSLRNALDLLGQLMGEITDEELIGRIFSRFCIGK